MATKPDADLTGLLHAWRGGDSSARDRVVEQVYGALRRMAAARMGEAERSPTLQPTALVHEALMRLLGSDVDWNNRSHFLAVAALQMRNILVDHARARLAAKRGGGAVMVTLDGVDSAQPQHEADLLALEQALSLLEKRDPRLARVIEMTYFGGMQRDEIADVLQVSIATVDRDLRFGRAFLGKQLSA